MGKAAGFLLPVVSVRRISRHHDRPVLLYCLGNGRMTGNTCQPFTSFVGTVRRSELLAAYLGSLQQDSLAKH
jgi:hypothetical protein